MSYPSVDALQRTLAEKVFHYAADRKKASGRALGTLIEIITYYTLKSWGLRDSLAIERPLVQRHRAANESVAKTAKRTDCARRQKLGGDTHLMSAGRTVNTLSQEWGTPEKYVAAVKRVFGGHIDLDPCSNDYSIVGADTEYRLPEKDGLKESWDFPRIFVNPPYGIDKERGTSIKHWLYRCASAARNHDSEVLALVPVATNTGHWKNYVFVRAVGVCFLYDTRLKFLIDGRDEGKGAPMSCAMVYWGKHYQKFYDVFIRHGAVLDLRLLYGTQIGENDRMVAPVLLAEF